MNQEEKKRVALEAATYEQIARIAHEAATWYKAALLQSVRFYNATKQGFNDPFDLPWSEDTPYPFVPEKVYFLLAVNHALDFVNDLNIALMSKNDYRLDSAAKRLLNVEDFHTKIKKVRNANEHSVDYLFGTGRKQAEFVSTVPTKLGNIATNAHWYIHIGEDAYIGNINVVEMLNHLRDSRD